MSIFICLGPSGVLYEFDFWNGLETEYLGSVTGALHDHLTNPQYQPWTPRVLCASWVAARVVTCHCWEQ